MLLDDCYASFLNLDHRKDRLALMEEALAKAGIIACRTRGKLPKEFELYHPSLRRMVMRTPGAVGCHFGQVEIMKHALSLNKHAFVMEDDLCFCSDFHARIRYLEDFLSDKQWDVIWLGGTIHIDSPWWHKNGHSEMPECPCNNNADYEKTEDPKIIRTFGAFSTFSYIVNRNSIDKILKLFDWHIENSIGIDYLFIRIQPELNCYMLLPGMVKQRDNQSDIGTGWTIFSGFSKLGPHWYQDKM